MRNQAETESATEKGEPMQKITLNRLMDAIEESEFPGFCLACGEQADGVEPDARAYKCAGCGAHQVYGAEELLVRIVA